MRSRLEAAFFAAVRACDPAALVAAAVPRDRGALVGLAVGKAALAMARGCGAVSRGLCVVPAGSPRAALDTPASSSPLGPDDLHAVPPGWSLLVAAHPLPDETSLAAGAAVVALVESVRADETLVALVSGGASSLIEQPRDSLADYLAAVRAAQAAGMPIAELNALRSSLSTIKGGRLARRCAGRVMTLAVSDVIRDDPRVIGSGPTVAPERIAAGRDEVRVIAPMISAARLAAAHLDVPLRAEPLAGDVQAVAALLAATPASLVAWGEPTLSLPAHPGEGGRAQHLALLLARAFAGTARCALVAGTDGIDGPHPRDRPAPAGAFVDGTTWSRIDDPDRALASRDAGSALATAGALFVPGPTGVNHADLILIT